jgi:hypothetical protein
MRPDSFLLLWLHANIFSDGFLEVWSKNLQVGCEFNSFSIDAGDKLLEDYASDIRRIVWAIEKFVKMDRKRKFDFGEFVSKVL